MSRSKKKKNIYCDLKLNFGWWYTPYPIHHKNKHGSSVTGSLTLTWHEMKMRHVILIAKWKEQPINIINPFIYFLSAFSLFRLKMGYDHDFYMTIHKMYTFSLFWWLKLKARHHIINSSSTRAYTKKKSEGKCGLSWLEMFFGQTPKKISCGRTIYLSWPMTMMTMVNQTNEKTTSKHDMPCLFGIYFFSLNDKI